MAAGNDEILERIDRNISELRAQVDGLLHDFGPLIAAFRPQNGQPRPSYIELAGAARVARRARRQERQQDE